MNAARADLENAPMGPRPPSERVSCEHAEVCAGCPLIHLTYPDQLDKKRQRVKGAASLYPRLSQIEIEAVSAADPIVGYRVRAKLMVGFERAEGLAGRASIGLFARASKGQDDHRIVDIPGCRVLAASLHGVASKLRGLLQDPPKEAGPCLVPEAAGGLLSAFDLREVVDQCAGVFVTLVLGSGRPLENGELSCAARALQDLSPDIVGVAVNFRDPRAVQVLGSTTRLLAGSTVERDRLGSTYRLATYGSFTQVHRPQARRIGDFIASNMGAGATRVLDLYGGSGALSLPLARGGARVTLVESFRPAAECAERAARDQGIDGFDVRTGDAATVLRDLSAKRLRFDAIIANPPRRGMPPSVRAAIAALEPSLLAYVSCDPDTLFRDLDHLSRLGYQTDGVVPVDMIPLTDHVETVAFLTKSVRPEPVILYEDDDLFILERFAHDPQLRGAHSSGSRLGDARIVAGAAGSASGLVIGCKARGRGAELEAALADPGAQFTYLALCRGIVARSGVAQQRIGYRRLARAAGHSVVRATARGRANNRIERDLAAMGHPVIGDTRHGHAPTNRHFEEKYGLDRPFLHCLQVDFRHPVTGARIAVQGTVPGELTMVLGRLDVVALDVAKEVMVG